MVLILNILFAVLAFVIVRYLLQLGKVGDPANVVISVLVAVLVFLANLGAKV